MEDGGIQCAIHPPVKITKRTVLHTNASVFDPLEWLTPLMLRTKCFFQSLWIKSYDWDEILTEEDQEQWKKLCDSINNFRMELPRRVASKRIVHQLVAFSDASTSAMAACVYVKQGNPQELLVAKSKLPSIKGVHTIPKLEMNALTIAGRLTLTTYEELKKTITVDAVYLLSDSEMVLSWLKNGDPSKVTGVLVSNRVKELKRIAAKFKEEGVKVYFGYISTEHNPADCATRGLTAEELHEHIRWKGPEFLTKEQKDWPE
ncbi:Pao retrotransposon peptidase [Ancylostoma duodenale]|uniref:Pao retrotransposon peptidase n=1 Tax=Ancylostoma duodenale TaxID=51022 RepID=A0A0C2H5I3_9BILA|nr:Pao retrotransposon peptidase [Ancylostoma duodenale]